MVGSTRGVAIPLLSLVLACGPQPSPAAPANRSANRAATQDDDGCREFEQYLNKYFPDDTGNSEAERIVVHKKMAGKVVSGNKVHVNYPINCQSSGPDRTEDNGACGGDYFPPNALGFHVEAQKICERPPPEWWNIENLASERLRKWNEPTLLWTPESDLETYRFLYAPPEGNGAVVRIEKNRDGRFLIAKYRACGNTSKSLDVVEYRKLSSEQWAKFQAMMNKAAFWTLPVQVNRPIRDGTTWLIEGKDDEHYHLVARTSPEVGFFRRTGEYLMALAGIDEVGISCSEPRTP